ncbi:ribonuclease E [Sodalis-like secondary symbiont of Drepanosiphum platanoidis]|uniref:ribonuclease E n=1 Tax=Sodalis-like secondary symbiont of Drepanosiphum platanoidis TaxID=2994493 RepID=UPI003463CBDE
MKRMLINATQEEELRIALVDGQKLYDLDIETFGNKQNKSNIYKGKIIRIEPSLEAVFVNYSLNRHGFLPLKEISSEYFSSKNFFKNKLNIKDLLYEGQEIIVQVNKEERGNKGAALTTFISLAGSYLILMPNNNKANGISRRIYGNDRLKIKKIISSLKIPKDMGLIIRTAGLGKSIQTLQCDLNFRLKHWKFIKKSAKYNSAPFLIYEERSILIRAFRDYLNIDIGEILIDNYNILNIAQNYIITLGRLDFLNKIKFYNKNIPLFNYYQIESQIESAFKREVKLNSGGSIVIDTMEALTAIDINSSKYRKGNDIEETALNTNLEATDEISRQIRLRDLGGLIVIDFIDMSLICNQRKIENFLKYAVREDRARIQIGKISSFGLLELSRQRLRSSLRDINHYTCPKCNGTGSIRDNKSLSLSILRIIEEEILKENTQEIHVIVPISIASYLLNEKRKAIYYIEKRKKNVRTVIVPSINMKTPNYEIIRVRKGEDKYIYSYLLPNFYMNKKNYYKENSNIYNKIKFKKNEKFIFKSNIKIFYKHKLLILYNFIFKILIFYLSYFYTIYKNILKNLKKKIIYFIKKKIIKFKKFLLIYKKYIFFIKNKINKKKINIYNFIKKILKINIIFNFKKFFCKKIYNKKNYIIFYRIYFFNKLKNNFYYINNNFLKKNILFFNKNLFNLKKKHKNNIYLLNNNIFIKINFYFSIKEKKNIYKKFFKKKNIYNIKNNFKIKKNKKNIFLIFYINKKNLLILSNNFFLQNIIINKFILNKKIIKIHFLKIEKFFIKKLLKNNKIKNLNIFNKNKLIFYKNFNNKDIKIIMEKKINNFLKKFLNINNIYEKFFNFNKNLIIKNKNILCKKKYKLIKKNISFNKSINLFIKQENKNFSSAPITKVPLVNYENIILQNISNIFIKKSCYIYKKKNFAGAHTAKNHSNSPIMKPIDN